MDSKALIKYSRYQKIKRTVVEHSALPLWLHFRRRLIRQYRQSPWFIEYMKCQEEIAAHPDVSKKYAELYSKQELFYTLCVVRWLFEDHREGKVLKCLDIGCGYGTLALYVKKLYENDVEVYCTDIGRNLSETLAGHYHLHFFLHNIELDPLPWDERFDLIIMTEVLEHLNFHPLPTMKKIRTLLNPGGRVYLSTPDAVQWGSAKYYANVEDMPYPQEQDSCALQIDHVHHFDKAELFELARSAGFNIERCGYSPGVKSRHFNLSLICK